jgi:hypothetical protein
LLTICSDRPARPYYLGLAQRSNIQNASKNVEMTESKEIGHPLMTESKEIGHPLI